MRITESKLREVIRSVLIEGKEKGLKYYKEKWKKIKKSEKAKSLDGYEEIEKNKEIDLNSLRGFILDYEDIHGKIRLEDK